MLTRIARVRPFALHQPTVPAAAVAPDALLAIEHFLARGRLELRARIESYLRWLQSSDGMQASPEQAQRRFTFLRLRFNAVLAQFDMFSDVITQRSEHDTGIWLSGLDVAAADALALPGYYRPPPVICYLDRGVGAAIRRARTRLPGGGENPVAIIRVPRERMIGSGIASSLVHEVGHQAAALLGLVEALRPVLTERWQREGGRQTSVWRFWERWISEILADLWSVARVGIGASLGLVAVVSLPRAFVLRVGMDDPHPFPWIRVKISCAVGQALYPHPQWARLARLWEAFYPLDGLDDERRRLLSSLDAGLPEFVSLLIAHRPDALQGRTLGAVIAPLQRQPSQLAALHRGWRSAPLEMGRAPPTLAFAVISQAKADGHMGPEEESRLLDGLLTRWALSNTLRPAALAARMPGAAAPDSC